MRLILTILLFISLGANATNYYVSNSGSDSNDGLTTATAWQTLSKVNSSSFNAGDSILLRRGDIWNERLNIASSGSAGSPIMVSAYGTGVKPLITGLQTVTLTNVGNIWSGIASNSVKKLNTVLVNGKIQAKGRFPNVNATNGGYLTLQTSTISSITSTDLTGTNYTGKECVVRSASWIIDVVKVSTQSAGTLNFNTSLTYNPNSLGGTGFFFQNDSTFLDQQGEWSYDSTTKKLCVYSTTTPIVQISTIDTLIYLNHKSYINFDNLSVQGANMAAFQFDSLSNITVQNCSINYSGAFALSAQKSSYLSAINDSIHNSLTGGIFWRRLDPYTPMQDTCNYAVVSGNYVKNTSVYAGMGMNDNCRYFGIYVVGRKSLISNNRVDSSGYVGICFNGDTCIVKNNFITNFCSIKDDGAGIYTVIGSEFSSGFNNGSIIKKNIVMNGISFPYGSSWTSVASGIYLDRGTINITVDSNSIYNCKISGLNVGQADYNTFSNNNIYNSIGHGITINGDNTYISAAGNQINNNAVYSGSSSWYTLYRYNNTNGSAGTNLGLVDNNYYSRPTNENGSMSFNGTAYSLYGFRGATVKDINSKITPSFLLNNTASFIYNPTQTDSTIYFTGRKISLRGVTYIGSITLRPFTSAILFDAIIPQQYPYKYYR